MERKQKELNIKNYAHIGDSLWEVYIREKTIFMTENLNKLHKYTVYFVNAGFQSRVLEMIKPSLNEEQLQLIKRARNIPTSPSRKIDKTLHSSATCLEVLLGYSYIHEKDNYSKLMVLIDGLIDFEEAKNS